MQFTVASAENSKDSLLFQQQTFPQPHTSRSSHYCMSIDSNSDSESYKDSFIWPSNSWVRSFAVLSFTLLIFLVILFASCVVDHLHGTTFSATTIHSNFLVAYRQSEARSSSASAQPHRPVQVQNVLETLVANDAMTRRSNGTRSASPSPSAASSSACQPEPYPLHPNELVERCVARLNTELPLNKLASPPSAGSSALNPARSARAAMQSHCASKLANESGALSLFGSAKLQQIFFCENADYIHLRAFSERHMPQAISEENVAERIVTFGPVTFRIFIMRKGDIVSDFVGRESSWEPLTVYMILMLLQGDLDISAMLTAMDTETGKETVDFSSTYAQQALPIIRQRGFRSASLQNSLIRFFRVFNETSQSSEANSRRAQRVFVDIGANIGWFSLVAASAGFSVYSFEPMKSNEIIFRKSICANELQERITYFNLGLSDRDQRCLIFSDASNVGDGNVACSTTGHDNEAVPSYKGYFMRNWIQLVRLDSVIDFEIPVMKIDVEGFEWFAMNGASKLLERNAVGVVFAEFGPSMMRDKRTDPTAFLHMMMNYGFEIRRSNEGKFERPLTMATATGFCENRSPCDIMMVHKSLLRRS